MNGGGGDSGPEDADAYITLDDVKVSVPSSAKKALSSPAPTTAARAPPPSESPEPDPEPAAASVPGQSALDTFSKDLFGVGFYAGRLSHAPDSPSRGRAC